MQRNINRVEAHTDAKVNERIERSMEARLHYFADNPEAIPARLRELEHEWDVERVLETGASSLSLTGLLLAITRGRGWLALPIAVQSFFFQHALQGWCPPLPLFRRMGVRTMREILKERAALIDILSDYRGGRIAGPGQPGPEMAAAGYR